MSRGSGLPEASWGPLGSLLVSWGHPGGLRDASWARLGASWGRLGARHGSNLVPKTEPKSIKNRSQNQSFFECLLGLDLYWILLDFERENRAKLAPRWHQQSMPTSEDYVCRKLSFSLGETMILKVLEVEVGTKNHSKIH